MFRLDKVLRYKERLEKEALAKRAAAESVLRELEEAATGFRSERRSLPDLPDPDLTQLRAWAMFAEGLRDRERRVREQIGQVRPKVSAVVQAHLEARKEVEGLRRLRERTLLRQKKLRDRRQQDLIDDVASRPFVPGTGNDFPPNAVELDARPAPNPAEMTVEAKMDLKREKQA